MKLIRQTALAALLAASLATAQAQSAVSEASALSALWISRSGAPPSVASGAGLNGIGSAEPASVILSILRSLTFFLSLGP